MLNSIGILLLTAAIVWYEVPSLLDKKYKKELLVFSILLAIGVVLGIMLGFGVTIPPPTKLVKFLFTPLTDLIAPLLK
ncbi:hypothetical protein CSV61_01960 [Sporosarcina sp. P3]|uniref:hypothetical protein n=1 Tax=Sporosarcina TaxID=1569 RepID=UPI0009DC7ECF|nr:MULTISPECIES: hypothetical protein [Sporosarcina]ARF16112.1 hypothetical protein SporoP17a_01600 [Sporosarcina ureae]PID23237.1 hypothetical protein CSV61_01960 [Sporosarcina sp. P3]